MRAREGETGRQRRRVGEVAAAALLSLLCGSGGCRWLGDSPPRDALLDPPLLAPAPTDRNSLPLAKPTRATPEAATPNRGVLPASADGTAGSVVQAGGPGAEAEEPKTSLANPVLVRTSYKPSPDAPHAEDKAIANQQGAMVAYHSNAAAQAADKNGDSRAATAKGSKDQPYEVDLTLPSPSKGMDTPVIPAPAQVQPVTMAAALARAGVANPVIALADQAVRASQADLLQARVLLMPDVNVGGSYHLHNGPLQSSFGAIRKVDLNSVDYGLGAGAVVAGTQSIPGLFLVAHLGDALFNPLVQSNVVANRTATAVATRNDVLLDVAGTYLALLRAEGRLAVLRQSEADFAEVTRLTTNYAKSGQGRQGDADRSAADLIAIQYDEQEAQAEVAVAAADLARLLNLDPSVRLQTGDVPIQVIALIDPKMSLPNLLRVALNNRPEMMAAAATIRASQLRVRQEKTRPLFPLLIAGFSADDFGGGTVATTAGNVFNPHTGNIPPIVNGQQGPVFGRIAGRTDVDVLAVWTLENAGFGNIALVRQRRAALGEAEAARVQILNEIEQQVSVAYNKSSERFLAIGLERRRVQEASEGFQLDLKRIRLGVGRPIEVLNQAKRLASARQLLLDAAIGFDRAQFDLFVALGQPPTLVVDEDKSPPPPAVAAEVPPPVPPK